uniref:Uncharacterized protein n=1 Tax=Candidatus Kentrum sp. LPFa TaxID=2126335 RepID=A0A450WK58_9GAMM|nr:MAG: hypothetical protein BECKLPF1236A_GA0070988_101709 [Candidatus Kentron sp. LPFa]VFK32287.1 MAG: hypothetical protein BECKLPF1236C_GA0070990_101628 [Candidatus Kentron sp. LPFa]
MGRFWISTLRFGTLMERLEDSTMRLGISITDTGKRPAGYSRSQPGTIRGAKPGGCTTEMRFLCEQKQTMKNIVPLFYVVAFLAGCAGASEGKSRSCGLWGCGPVQTDSCAAECAEWDSEGKVCLRFHDWTSERCARILSRELEYRHSYRY